MPRCRQNISAKALAFWIIPATVACDHIKRKDFTTTGHKEAKTLFHVLHIELEHMIFLLCQNLSTLSFEFRNHTTWCFCNHISCSTISPFPTWPLWLPGHPTCTQLSDKFRTVLFRPSWSDWGNQNHLELHKVTVGDLSWPSFYGLNMSFPGHQKSRNITFSESTFSETSKKRRFALSLPSSWVSTPCTFHRHACSAEWRSQLRRKEMPQKTTKRE